MTDDTEKPSDCDSPDVWSRAAEAGLRPLWQVGGLLPPHPQPSAVPHVWRWTDVKGYLDVAAKVGIGEVWERRALAFANPGLRGEPFATPTLWAAIQYILPGETAPAHRHSAAALRFVLRGSGVWTTVDGDPISMDSRDLVVTPANTWHSHHAVGRQPMVWFDGLDLPLVRYLDALFFEAGGELPQVPDIPGPSRSEQRFVSAGLVPSDSSTAESTSLLVYRWDDTDRALTSLLRQDDRGWTAVRFADPMSGLDIMPTLRAEALRVREGERTPVWQSTGSSVLVCLGGTGSVILDAVDHPLADFDVVAVPSMTALEVRAEQKSPVDFFVLSDAPVIEALGLCRGRGWAGAHQSTRRAHPAERGGIGGIRSSVVGHEAHHRCIYGPT